MQLSDGLQLMILDVKMTRLPCSRGPNPANYKRGGPILQYCEIC